MFSRLRTTLKLTIGVRGTILLFSFDLNKAIFYDIASWYVLFSNQIMGKW